MSLRGYNPLKVICSWSPVGFDAIDIADGRVSGDFFSTTEDNPRWAREFDAHGNATRVKNNNKGGTISITLSAASPTNLQLTRAAQLDDSTETVAGVLTVTDLNGTSRVVASGAFIQSIPDPTRSQERGSVTWVWECAKIEKQVGGFDTV